MVKQQNRLAGEVEQCPSHQLDKGLSNLLLLDQLDLWRPLPSQTDPVIPNFVFIALAD